MTLPPLVTLREQAEKWLKRYERDEVALTAECLEELLQHAYADALNQIPLKLVTALSFYADPDTYTAVAFRFDPPCGPFREDFENMGGPAGTRSARFKPGKLARETLDSLVKDLPYDPEYDSGEEQE